MLNKNILRKAQLIMLDELLELDRICKKYNINYWLDSGTLLGAKRHKGFIPWDDDIDISMLEEDYKKFLFVANKEINKEFFIQNKKTDQNFFMFWTKIRHRNSLFIEKDENEKELYHQGVSLDIFVMDSFNNKIRKIYRILSKLKNLGIHIEKNRYLILKKIILTLKVNKMAYYILNSLLEKSNSNSIIGYRYLFYKVHKYTDIFPLSEIEFEGYKFSCPNNVDAYLKNLYGNTYMELPPEKDRVWHAKEIKLNEKCFFEKELERTGRKLYDND